MIKTNDKMRNDWIDADLNYRKNMKNEKNTFVIQKEEKYSYTITIKYNIDNNNNINNVLETKKLKMKIII